MQKRSELGPMGEVILDSGVFKKFMEYTIDLHESWDLLQYMYIENLGEQSETKEVTIHNRPFCLNFVVEVNNKLIPQEYFEEIEKKIHIAEISQSKILVDKCMEVYKTLAVDESQKIKAIQKRTLDILSSEEFITNLRFLYPNLAAKWKSVWDELEEKVTEAYKRKDFMLNAAAFYIGSEICNVIKTREKGITLGLITVKEQDYNRNYIDKAAIEQKHPIGMYRYCHQMGMEVGYFAIQPTGLFWLAKDLSQIPLESSYIRTEKELYMPNSDQPIILSTIQAHHLNKFSKRNRNISRLSNLQLQEISSITGYAHNSIVHPIELEFGRSLMKQFEEDQIIFATPKEHEDIYKVFTACGLSWMLRKINMDQIKSKQFSQYIRTEDKLYYYHKWEDRLELLCQDQSKIAVFDKEYKLTLDQVSKSIRALHRFLKKFLSQEVTSSLTFDELMNIRHGLKYLESLVEQIKSTKEIEAFEPEQPKQSSIAFKKLMPLALLIQEQLDKRKFAFEIKRLIALHFNNDLRFFYLFNLVDLKLLTETQLNEMSDAYKKLKKLQEKTQFNTLTNEQVDKIFVIIGCQPTFFRPEEKKEEKHKKLAVALLEKFTSSGSPRLNSSERSGSSRSPSPSPRLEDSPRNDGLNSEISVNHRLSEQRKKHSLTADKKQIRRKSSPKRTDTQLSLLEVLPTLGSPIIVDKPHTIQRQTKSLPTTMEIKSQKL